MKSPRHLFSSHFSHFPYFSYSSLLALVLGAFVIPLSLWGTPAQGKASGKAPVRRGGLIDEFSGQGYNMAGCGLGSIALGSLPGRGRALASALINAMIFPQTFAISSGISNCGASGSKEASLNFIETNKVALKTDVARGQGETLLALADLMGCQNPQMGSALQRKSQQILSTDSSQEIASEVTKACQL